MNETNKKAAKIAGWFYSFAKAFGLEDEGLAIKSNILTDIRPVVSVDEETWVTWGYGGDVNLNAADATFVVTETVPTGKEWRLSVFTLGATTGTCALAVKDPKNGRVVHLTSKDTASKEWAGEERLQAGWQLGAIAGNGGVPDAVIRINYMYGERARY